MTFKEKETTQVEKKQESLETEIVSLINPLFLHLFLISDTKKRDQKDAHRNGDTRSGKGSAVKGQKADPGDYKNFPMIPEKSVQVLKGKGYRSLFPI